PSTPALKVRNCPGKKVNGMLPPSGFIMRNVLVSWVSQKMAATRSVPDQGRFRAGTADGRVAARVGEPAGPARETPAPSVGGGGAPDARSGGALPEGGLGSGARFASRATSPETRR